MTDEEAKVLGLRAVARHGWVWMGGMVNGLGGNRLFEADGWEGLWEGMREPEAFRPSQYDWPDFRDPATLGCLLALVRETWACPDANVSREGRWSGATGEWVAWHGGDGVAFGATEAEALVAALEAAPRREPAP